MVLDQIIKENKIYIAGPCSIESRDQILRIGKEVKEAGANILRGGAYKPRTSPYTFQGLGKEAVDYLVEAGRALDMPVVTEIVDVRDLPYFEEVDILQVGARNMQNFPLLRELGKTDKWILLKKSMAANISEFLSAADHIRASGNQKIILCERGMRTFEDKTRYTLDVSAVAVIKSLTDLKIIVDPSHASGKSDYIRPLALAGIAAGADGWMIEVHDRPDQALSDKDQAILPEELKEIIDKTKKIREVLI